MSYTVAIIAAGDMGSAVGARLGEHGVRVTTSLAGRSAASAARAEKAHMVPVADDDALVADADFFLSICPPGEAVALAQRMKPALTRSRKKLIYVDCNAVSPETAVEIGTVLEGTGVPYVDGGIIGLPPPGHTGTRIYVSGPAAREVSKLSDFGVPFPFLDGPIGAASALKMSYAGITKGLTAVAVAMVLGATRGGSAAALHKELEMSQPQLLAWLTRQVPRMPPKAYRWIAEMEEIGHFVGDGTPGGDMYASIAKIYEDVAAALRAPQTADNPVAQLAAFFEPAETKERKRA
jgi:putative dehydrogenase